jgi:nucleotide-binding universal stress UspA family protein
MLPPKLILAPVDFSDPSRVALNAAVDMASCFDAELLIAYVVPAIPDLPTGVSILKEGQYDQSLVDASAQRLSELASELTGGPASKNVKVRTEVGVANDVGMELIRIAEHNNADMIIIATHGMTGWRRFAFGSVAEKVVKEAGCPVLVLRANAAAAENKEEAASSAAAS